MSDAPTGPACLQWQPGTINTATSRLLAQVMFADDASVWSCPLIWLAGDFTAESWLLDAPIKTGTAHGWHYRRHGSLAFAALHIDDGEPGNQPHAIQQAAHDAYRQLFALQQELGLSHAQRIWHWLSDVTAGTGDDERYQRFCRGRAEALDTPGHGMQALPPATLVSSHRRGLRMHALLGDTPIEPVENPRQVSAYRYPRDYGVRPPAFARAGVVCMANTRYLLVSGTGSIVGHETRHIGDVEAQAREALANIDAVIAAAGQPAAAYHMECMKAYVRHPDHAPAVLALLRARLPDVAVAVLHAPLCRDGLLVEFETQIRLSPA